ncbi:DUF3471 domain-containing protein [uncultured Aquimarina sp.]|uniref:DUF3471 domain-containing protein n=1 Tax=uncultured Aquimarina sp. TaxID=575652 RepID=UPI00261EF2CC|nr:DUF3471 domain-containing protein [uncultured Aquimarina sp.]
MTFKLKTVFFIFILVSITNGYTQTKSDILLTLKAKDSLLFEVGFNQCNLVQIEKLIAHDIEFYHDRDGITKSREKFIASIKNNLCSSGKNMINRVLDDSSFEVFPLYKNGELYGAIQNGSHRFGQTQATYSHLWLIEKQQWKLSRVLSYNHHQDQNISITESLKLSIDELKQYVGEYKFSPEFILTVSLKDGQLYGESQGQGVKINCYDKHKFIDDERTHDLEFLLNQHGNVTGLHMKGSGMEMTAQKR